MSCCKMRQPLNQIARYADANERPSAQVAILCGIDAIRWKKEDEEEEDDDDDDLPGERLRHVKLDFASNEMLDSFSTVYCHLLFWFFSMLKRVLVHFKPNFTS